MNLHYKQYELLILSTATWNNTRIMPGEKKTPLRVILDSRIPTFITFMHHTEDCAI